MKHLLLFSLLLLVGRHAECSADNLVLSAARSTDASVAWQAKSILKADFTCQGKVEYAILGTRKAEIVVAVYRPPSTKPLDVLRYSGTARDPVSAILEIEPLDFDVEQLAKDIGYSPDGLQSSKTCVGLNMTDQKSDSAHIYWHRKKRRFENWVL